MTRIKAAVSLMIIILALCICSLMIIRNFTSDVYEFTDNIITAMENGDKEKASEYADEILNYCEKSRIMLNPIIRKDKMVSLYTSIVRLKPLIEHNSDDVYAEIENIDAMLKFILENEFPYMRFFRGINKGR